jgi:hypothetical protein
MELLQFVITHTAAESNQARSGETRGMFGLWLNVSHFA